MKLGLGLGLNKQGAAQSANPNAITDPDTGLTLTDPDTGQVITEPEEEE